MSERIDDGEAGLSDGRGAAEEVRLAWLRLLGLLADEVVRQLDLGGSRPEGRPMTGDRENVGHRDQKEGRPSG